MRMLLVGLAACLIGLCSTTTVRAQNKTQADADASQKVALNEWGHAWEGYLTQSARAHDDAVALNLIFMEYVNKVGKLTFKESQAIQTWIKTANDDISNADNSVAIAKTKYDEGQTLYTGGCTAYDNKDWNTACSKYDGAWWSYIVSEANSGQASICLDGAEQQIAYIRAILDLYP